MEWLIRFLIGGAVVSLFAMFADVLRPKGFAGLFGAAPSVAIATLALTIHSRGVAYATLEARSMLVGEVALLAYAGLCVYLMGVRKVRASSATILMLPAWLAVSLGLYFAVLHQW